MATKVFFGSTLEIVPFQIPFNLKLGGTLRVRVLFQGKGLADANLGVDRPGDVEQSSGTVRTDANEEANIPIGHLGLMTIRRSHMTRPKADDFEWESVRPELFIGRSRQFVAEMR